MAIKASVYLNKDVLLVFSLQANDDDKENTLMEQTLEPDNTLLSVFPHESHEERYIHVLRELKTTWMTMMRSEVKVSANMQPTKFVIMLSVT